MSYYKYTYTLLEYFHFSSRCDTIPHFLPQRTYSNMNNLQPAAQKGISVYNLLNKHIAEGIIETGQKLPSESELCEHFNVSRSTIVRALRKLRSEGLIESRRGAGHYAANALDKKRQLFGLLSELSPITDPNGQLVQFQIQLSLQLQTNRDGLIPHSTGVTIHDALDASESLIQQGVKGVAFVPLEVSEDKQDINQKIINKFTEANVSVVLIDRDTTPPPTRSSCDLITPNHRMIGFVATNHVVQKNAKNIAFIGNNKNAPAIIDRLFGYKEALERSKLKINPNLIWTPDRKDYSAEWVAEKIRKHSPDAIVCKSDKYARIAMEGIKLSKKQIPKNCLLIGTSGESFSSELSPPLSTVSTCMNTLATQAKYLLQRRAQNPNARPIHIMPNCQLIERQSTKHCFK